MGGGAVVHFQPVRSFFQKFLLVSIIFFTNPLLEFYFFSKNCWRGGGGGGGGKNVSGQKFFQDIKKGSKKFSGPASVYLRFKTHFPWQILLKTCLKRVFWNNICMQHLGLENFVSYHYWYQKTFYFPNLGATLTRLIIFPFESLCLFFFYTFRARIFFPVSPARFLFLLLPPPPPPPPHHFSNDPPLTNIIIYIKILLYCDWLIWLVEKQCQWEDLLKTVTDFVKTKQTWRRATKSKSWVWVENMTFIFF